MRIGVLGTGMVGSTLASRFVELGHDVVMGSRSATNEKATAWAAQHTERAANGSFADAAAHGELVVNATSGASSLAALEAAGADNLAGKVLVDVANAISGYGPPMTLDPVGDDSLAERIQRAFPDARVVKTLNTVNAAVMVAPAAMGVPHDVFVAGEDAEAKATVRGLLQEMGWAEQDIRDVGGVTAARGLEMYLVLWLSLAGSLGRYDFNIHVVTPGAV
jgi:8-hydroxy-5-deazaflavin:NADPH oxidoreductase